MYILMLFIITSTYLFACDDTLIMMLTAKNPAGEFSKVIRAFSSNLTNLGLALDQNKVEDIPINLKNVMASWLNFTKAYACNPPKEARNDTNWISKIKKTSKEIGLIRSLVTTGKRLKAHDMVLDLSSKMGMFFEGFGISKEKQMFIDTSAHLTRFEMFFRQNNKEKMKLNLKQLKQDLNKFQKSLPKEAQESNLRAKNILASITWQLNNKINSASMTILIDKSKTTFQELRSHILMKEWFSDDNPTKKEKKE